MTKKDFLLIQDAVNEGIEAFITENFSDIPLNTERWLRRQLAVKLAVRLRYTSDSFDGKKFTTGITSVEPVSRRLGLLSLNSEKDPSQKEGANPC